MYRVHGNDGETYEAPSLAILQQWVEEGRVIASTTVEDLLGGTEGPASGIAGLRFGPSQPFGESPPPGVGYPRAASGQPVGCSVHLPLALAIASAICCSPIGVIAVIYAAKIPQILEQGDVEKARRYSRISLRVSSLSLILFFLYVLLVMKYGKAMGLPVS